MTAILVLLTAFVLAALFLGAAAVVQLARLQSAVMKHRASSGTFDDDDELYRSAGFGNRPVRPTFMRGEQIR